jgi:4'-phosphopantetheinyl transferase
MHRLTASDFVAARPPVDLQPDEIQLWFAASGAAPGARVAHAWMRTLLAGYLDCAPAHVRIARGEHGKPRLPDRPDLEFNLSHSGAALLLGIARAQPLGVDIEMVARRRPVLELAHRFFSSGEAAALARLDAARQQAAFLRLWSSKEAVVKALGRGLGFGLARVAFDIDAGGEPTGLNVIDSSAGAAAEWHIAQLLPTPAHAGALAWRGPQRRLRAFSTIGP